MTAMRILVLQPPASTVAYERWLLDAVPGAEVMIFSGTGGKRDWATPADGLRLELSDDYASAAGTRQLTELCLRWRPDVIFGNSEQDVLRAGELRTLLGIAGQDSRTAVAFRDKVRMKTLFAGLPLPAVPYRSVRCVADVLAAVDEFGTAVLKPRSGSGARGVEIFRSPQEVRAALLAQPEGLEDIASGAFFCEQFIEGNVYHVDAVVDGDHLGIVLPSRYLDPPHTFHEHNVGAVTVDPGSATYARLVDFISRFVARLPEGHGVGVLHAEFLQDRTGALYAAEIACRQGGSFVRRAVRHAVGVDLARAAALSSVGLAGLELANRHPAKAVGWLSFTATAPPGVDTLQAEPGVVEHIHRERSAAAGSSVDFDAALVLEGTSAAEVTARLRQLSTSSRGSLFKSTAG